MGAPQPVATGDPAGAPRYDPEHDEAFTCPNCGLVDTGEYCSDCGQKRVHDGDLSLHHAWHHLVHETLHLDGRIFHSLKLLFTKPGQLTLDYPRGGAPGTCIPCGSFSRRAPSSSW